MNMSISDEEIAALVQPDRVHKRVYTDPGIFDLEMERIWGNAWIFIGHESQVKSPGDFFTTTIGKQPVIVTRHSNNRIYVLYNRCAHKGAQLTVAPCGQARQGPDLTSWLGPAVTSIDNAVDRSPTGELEITGGTLRYMHDANWKILLENVSYNMHPAVTHQSAWQPAKQAAGEYPDDQKPLPLAMLEPFSSSYDFFDTIAMTTCGNGHTWSGSNATIHTGYPRESKYVQDLAARHGEEKAKRVLSQQRQNTIIYPSIAFKSALQTIRVYRPIAVDRTIQETWTYRLGGVSDDMLHTSVLYNQMIFSPYSIAGHDDYEAYHRIQQGLQTEASEWVSQHRHFGRDRRNNDGTVQAAGTSDIVFRHEFQAWKDYMLSPSGVP